jgi:hypothetical protein
MRKKSLREASTFMEHSEHAATCDSAPTPFALSSPLDLKTPPPRRKPTWRLPRIASEPAGEGFRHVLRGKDLASFLRALPWWDGLGRGLETILLARGESGLLSWQLPGLIGLCAWDAGLKLSLSRAEAARHAWLLERLGASTRVNGRLELTFTQDSARAFQLLGVFLDELERFRRREQDRQAQGGSLAYPAGPVFPLERETLADAYLSMR